MLLLFMRIDIRYYNILYFNYQWEFYSNKSISNSVRYRVRGTADYYIFFTILWDIYISIVKLTRSNRMIIDEIS